MRYTSSLFKNTRQLIFVPTIFLLFTVISCRKYLDKKSNQALVVPSSLGDLQVILDDNLTINRSPSYLELVADNYYVSTTVLNAGILEEERLNYLWDKDARIIYNESVWLFPYMTVLRANLVLDILPTILIEPSEQSAYNNIKGQALYHRAFQFYQLAQLFCKPYSGTATTDPGIVLKLTPIVTETYTRSTVQQTYDRIIADLKEAANLLPVASLFTTRPSKAAAYGALSRTYLAMRDYSNALNYADSALTLKNNLLDYKTLNPINTLPASYVTNPEVLFFNSTSTDLLNFPRPIVDSNLYQSYNNNDLRKWVYFGNYAGGAKYFKGSYQSLTAFYSQFTGIATDEIYLIRAECLARAGDKDGAMGTLNTLLRNRYDSTFTDIVATDSGDALNKIQIERRKELLFRGIRWTDLRRYNLENAGISLTRIVDGVTYTIPPNDLRWVLLIPDAEVKRSGITQNPR